LVIKTLDPDWIRIGIQLKVLDPDKMKTDPKRTGTAQNLHQGTNAAGTASTEYRTSAGDKRFLNQLKF
jgi:hypothetical protein